MEREEAINLVKQVLPCLNIDEKIREGFETLIPELKENENERIRMALIKLMTVAGENYVMSATGFEKEQLIAYLEKQKEQKLGATINGEPIPTENQSVDIPLAEWSEEDEHRRDGIIQWLREYQWQFNPKYDSLSIESIESLIDWLKSFPERFNLQAK